MWQLALGVLQANQAQNEARIEQDDQKKLEDRDRILKNRATTDSIKNKTVSANYGQFDMNNLINGVFTNKQRGGQNGII